MTKAEKYEKELLKVIKENKIAFFDHCFAFTSFSRTTGYEYKLNDSDAIKSAIHSNRVNAKNYMLSKWIQGDNATLQVAAFRLLSDSEEHKKLNQSYVDHTTKEEKLPMLNITYSKRSDKEKESDKND